MTNKKIKRATGNYTQELVNNLVKPKQMKNEVGGVETGGEVVDTGGDGVEPGGEKKELEVEDPNSYIAALREREESIVDQYNADINYAEQLKDDAYKKAKDQYGIAMREAQGNFRANQPTYGAKAEQLLASGLTGGGYSDYLAGKAYEARTDEINAARSQQSYAQYLADSNYRDMMHKAEQDKFDRQYANDQWKLDYGVQLDAEYNAKVDQVINDIINGNYSAAVAENILKNYAPNGVVSQNIIDSLKAQEDQFWKINNSGVTADVMAFMMDANNQSAYLLKKYLEDSTNLTDEQIQAYLDVYFDENGKLREELIKPQDPPEDPDDDDQGGNNPNFKYKIENGHIWISTDGGKTWKDYGEPKEGGTGDIDPNPDNTGGTGDGENNAKDENLTDAVKYLREAAKNGLSGADAYNEFKRAMNKHDIGDYNSYKKLLDEVDRLVTEGKFDADVAAKMKDMTNGLVVGSGVFEENRGLKKKFQNGDNFTVNVNGLSYKVESGGEANSNVITLSKGLKDGVVFGYGSELYLKSGDTAYKIEPRPVFGNKDYDKLWSAVYGEAINNIAEGKGFVQSNEGKATDKKSIKEDNLLDWGEKQDGTYEEEDVPEVPKNDNNIQSDAAASAGVNIGAAIANLFKKNDSEGNPDDDNISLEGTVTQATDTANAKFKNDAWGSKKDLSKGDNFNIEVNGKTYRVESGGKIDNSGLIDVFEGAGIGNDEVFEYDGQAYLKRGGTYYSIDTRLWMGKQEDKLVDAIKSNEHGRSGIAKGFSGKVTITDDEQNPEDIRFIPANNGEAMLHLSPDEDTRTNYTENQVKGTHNEKDKFDLPQEARVALRGIKDDVAVVYSGGKFYIKFISGNSTKYYEFTPKSNTDRDNLIKALN